MEMANRKLIPILLFLIVLLSVGVFSSAVENIFPNEDSVPFVKLGGTEIYCELSGCEMEGDINMGGNNILSATWINATYTNLTVNYTSVIGLPWNRSGTNVFLSNIGDNVGIGTTTPTHNFEVNGNVSLNNTLYVNNGYVGINITNPGEKLEVLGNINSTKGDICITGDECLSNTNIADYSLYTGSDLSSSDGEASRTLTYSNTAVQIFLDGMFLDPTIDWTQSGSTITFIVNVFDSQRITIHY